jgi:hypothetical protein
MKGARIPQRLKTRGDNPANSLVRSIGSVGVTIDNHR